MAHDLIAKPLTLWRIMRRFGQGAPQGELCMTKFRPLVWMMVATAGLILSASQSYAQKPDVGDQPGLLADDSVELEPEYRRTAVLYRTSEQPGTIIIATR